MINGSRLMINGSWLMINGSRFVVLRRAKRQSRAHGDGLKYDKYGIQK